LLREAKMKATSTGSKDCWNKENYTQIKVSVCPEVAGAFKAACVASGVSMASVLGAFMSAYAGKTVSTSAKRPANRRQRRKELVAIIKGLEQIRSGEEAYRDNIPENLSGSIVFDSADQSAALLDEALALLHEVY
jgi:hypothetical protein